MIERRIVWEGETYVSVRDAASCYAIEVRVITEWIDEELLDPPKTIRGVRALPVRDLDRLALLVHYTRLLGLECGAIRLILGR
jgi:hypothetical protein